jgi:hypothetical protein
MAHPTSLRLPGPVKDRLDESADREQKKPSAVAVRLIDEGLRMAEHPGVTFHDSLAYGRVASLAGGPDIAEVIEVLGGLEATGEDRLTESAEWFGIHPSQVRLAMGYYAAHQDEIDRQVDRRHQEADELRRRLVAEQALLG